MGAKVILSGKREEKLIETVGMLASPDNLFYPSDITDYLEIERIIGDAVEKSSPINGFIHSAGIELILYLSVGKPTQVLQIKKYI